MKYKYTILWGIIWAVVFGILGGIVFSKVLGLPGIAVGIIFAVAFGSCGCLFGYPMDRKNNSK